MMQARRWSVPVMLAAGIAAVAVFVWLYPYAIPTAALRMRVFQGGAEARAEGFLRQEGVWLPRGYRRSSRFTTNDYEKTYLEQTLGLPRANQVLQRDGFVYAWRVRWFKPGEQTQYWVSVDPDGRIIGYSQRLPDDAPAPRSTHPEVSARAFAARTARIDLAGYDLKQKSEVPRPRRRDYQYVWERRGFRLGEATQRVAVTVTGDRVVSYGRWVDVPEAFWQRYDRENEKGELLAKIAAVLSAGFLVVALVGLVIGAARRELQWRRGLWPACVLAAILVLNAANLLPLQRAMQSTTDTDATFAIRTVTAVLSGAVGALLGMWLLVVGAEWWYRRGFPGQVTLWHWFSREGLASSGGRKRLLAGYVLAALQLAYVAVFYALASRLIGAWSPAQVRYEDLFSTSAPWAYALLVGVQASLSEEFLFRVVAISWLRRWLKRDWLAILIPALVWGFAHANYPNKPFYIRGIELSIWGLVFGWMLVRYGVLPSVVAHASYNAVLAGSGFLTSVIWAPRLSFLVVLALTLAPLGLARWWARRGLGREPVPLNPEPRKEVEPAAEEAVSRRSEEPERTPIPRRAWVIGAALAVIGGGTLGVLEGVKHQDAQFRWAEAGQSALHTRYVARTGAVRWATAALPMKGAEVKGWVMGARVEEQGADPEALAYLSQYLRSGDVEGLLLRTKPPSWLWRVRWQRPLARESWDVLVRPEGGIWDVGHVLPEEAPGRATSQEAAGSLARHALLASGIKAEHYELTGQDQHDYPKRRSYTFRYAPKGLHVREAQFITTVTVDDGRAQWVEQSVTPPDSFEFDRAKERPWRTVLAAAGGLGWTAIVIWGVVIYFRAVRRYRMEWRWAARAVTGLAALAGVVAALQYRTSLTDLSSTTAPMAFLATEAIGVVVLLLLAGAALFAALPPSVALWRAHLGAIPGPQHWWEAVCAPRKHWAEWREAILAQVIVAGVVLVVAAVTEGLEMGLPPVRWLGSGDVTVPDWMVKLSATAVNDPPLGLSGYLPGVAAALTGVAVAAALVLAWTAMVAFGKATFGSKRRALICLGALTLIPTLAEARGWRAMVTDGTGAMLAVGAVWALYALTLRYNPLTLAATALLLVGFGEGAGFLAFPAHRVSAIALLVASGSLVIAALWGAIVAWRRPRRATAADTETAEITAAGTSGETG